MMDMVGQGHGSSTQSQSQIVPALAVTNRVMMHWERSPEGFSDLERAAYLVKSPSRPCTRASFAVLPVGVRDVPASYRTPQVRPRPNSDTRPLQEIQQSDFQNETAHSARFPDDERQSSAYNTTAENISEYKRVGGGSACNDEAIVYFNDIFVYSILFSTISLP
eukprot:CAMPEP_0114420028 /NCGR_PEP_ID=MMETSP0103-20121206/4343_1 /TAXON_ID=37642 ORGANISM="Paraphysomonas imperforata, Strain PA2" /NCGR_SAMPLE_ID=MMETSP0103 /ASSEMBLY_ACC=CAM_ASM_000201 /LENGTH=163 /DNA_ID=CAMNT_0001588489 /DNA_START=41 /DNA_END=529 /DNA_ORIENTATION=-